MWKLILKNLWSRRKRNGWLMAELVLVSVVTFIIVDPIVVLNHYLNQPLGYDAERLCLVEVARVDERVPFYSSDDTDDESKLANMVRLKQKLAAHPDVESVTLLSWSYINSKGSSSMGMSIDSARMFHPYRIDAISGENFFETYGIKSAPGSPSPEELSKLVTSGSEMIITRDIAEILFPGQNAVGKELLSIWEGDTSRYPIRAVVEPISPYIMRGNTPLMFRLAPLRGGEYPNYSQNILLRIKPGVDMDTFLGKFRPWAVEEGSAGNWYVQSVQTYNDHLTTYEYTMGVTNEIRLNIAYAVFFLVNLCLGVIGTFWLQTRKRTEEAGIMRSFGARRSDIVQMLLGEGVVLTVVSSLIGFFLYFQYAWSEGLYVSSWNQESLKYFQHDWIHQFGPHFMGVAGIVLLLLVVVVSIGIYIPARNISRVNPVDALRDE